MWPSASYSSRVFSLGSSLLASLRARLSSARDVGSKIASAGTCQAGTHKHWCAAYRYWIQAPCICNVWHCIYKEREVAQTQADHECSKWSTSRTALASEADRYALPLHSLPCLKPCLYSQHALPGAYSAIKAPRSRLSYTPEADDCRWCSTICCTSSYNFCIPSSQQRWLVLQQGQTCCPSCVHLHHASSQFQRHGTAPCHAECLQQQVKLCA